HEVEAVFSYTTCAAAAVRRRDGSITRDFVDVKSERSRRSVTLPPIALKRLKTHRKEQAARRLLLGTQWADLALVCDHGDGHWLNPDAFSRAAKPFLAPAGLPQSVRLHDIRHAVATALLAKNVHPAITSAVLGHSSQAFTMRTYQHMLDGMTDVAA